MGLKFNALLIDEGFRLSEVRLLRHQTGKVKGRTPYSMWRDDVAGFECYQSTQDSAPRERAKFIGRYWASFVSPPAGGTLFVGMYEARRVGSVPAGTIDPFTGVEVGADKPYPYDQYETRRLDALSGYIGRLSIHWGDSPSASRAWVQRADSLDKPIIELTRTFQEEEFPGFTRLIRPLSEIASMPATWREVLRATRGVYLLACPRESRHYVGSAYGADGFLGRWTAYATDGHGGNLGLRIRDSSDYLVSVLEVAGSNMSVEEIIALENVWKVKLHSRDMGLNHN